MSGVRRRGRALERMILCVVLPVGPLPPYVHLVFTWRHSCDECSQTFPIFHQSSTLVHYCERKWKVKTEGKNGGGLGTSFVLDYCLFSKHDYICVGSLDIIQVTNTHILYYIILYYIILCLFHILGYNMSLLYIGNTVCNPQWNNVWFLPGTATYVTQKDQNKERLWCASMCFDRKCLQLLWWTLKPCYVRRRILFVMYRKSP